MTVRTTLRVKQTCSKSNMKMWTYNVSSLANNSWSNLLIRLELIDWTQMLTGFRYNTPTRSPICSTTIRIASSIQWQEAKRWLAHGTCTCHYHHTNSINTCTRSTATRSVVTARHKGYSKPGPIMLFKLPIILLRKAPKFSLLCPNYAQLCFIIPHKLLLPESEDKSISLTQNSWEQWTSQLAL